jgi:membrane protein YdbS with pleckstrin-like domain
MQYRCPQCQSAKIMPVAQGSNAVRPEIPKSLVILVFSIFLLLLLVIACIVMWIFAHGASPILQIATGVVFLVTVGSGLLFWRSFQTLNYQCKDFFSHKKHGNAVTAIMSGTYKILKP